MKQGRDFIGYGRRGMRAQWPGAARVAVMFVVNYEEGGENCILNSDPHSESFLSEIVGAEPRAQVRHMNMESIYEYGSRAGFWRLYRFFTEANISVTAQVVAQALAANPEATAAMRQADWELCSHGLKWIDYQYINKATERQHLAQALQLQQQLTGAQPAGIYLGRTSPNSRELYYEHDCLIYDADSYADDLPYWLHKPDGSPHLVIPYTLDVNDMRFATNQGFNSSEQFYTYMRDSFDVLYQEGEHYPKMLSIGLHCRLVGRPGRFAALQRFVDYISAFDRVWLCRRIDIAEHWYKHYLP